MKKPKPTWIKITIHLLSSWPDKTLTAMPLIEKFERTFKIKHLYYARYTSPDTSRLEISALTAVPQKILAIFFSKLWEIDHIEFETRGTGSLAHAYMYQAVKRLPPCDLSQVNDDSFLDVLHWAANMRGLDYLKETRLLSFRAFILADQFVQESDSMMKNLQLKRAGPPASASTLMERLNLLGKDRASVKKSSRAPSPAQKKQLRAVSRKAAASTRSLISGLAHR